ncbi:deoxycytidylate deaminase-like isoform X2 [Salvelinus namaycush]|uniref:Deoxycytidylate deaminase n=1 Tax=Salvelinus namaycush TaxID=8040 RepID=A0A8U0Q688_SALNM|nr:deoxycytidylate deaminase-like isoform X2 [Salvelinus namaycush]
MSQEMKHEASQLNGTPASDSAQTKKREDYLEWPEYFMAVAFLSAQRSKDPSSQVGACIVNRENKIVGIGYNGMPNGCDDDLLPWSCSANDRLDTKYPYVCHAELNAIMNKNSADVKGCSMYVALFPCNECAKLIIQAGSSSPSETRLSSILILLTTLGCSTEQAEHTHLEKERRGKERVGALMSTPPLTTYHD